MNYEVYVIYDRIVGTYAAPFIQPNELSAKRLFDYQMSKSEMVATDCELYRIGTFDSKTGLVTSFEKPVFIANFVGEVKQ